MSIHRRAARKDDNHTAIVEALRAAGATVEAISGTGTPDLLCGFRGQNFLLEVKTEKEFINEHQAAWFYSWKGRQVQVVRTPEQALTAVGAMKTRTMQEQAAFDSGGYRGMP